jgi:hypothetical protein
MKKTTLIILFVVGLIASVSVTAAESELSASARLRKLSLHLRGFPPSREEFIELGAATVVENNELEAYWRKKTEEYLSSPQHIAKMASRLDGLFRFRLSEAPGERYFADIANETLLSSNGYTLPSYPSDGIQNPADSLFRRIVAKDESWDRLLTSGDYLVYEIKTLGTPVAFSPDRDFLEALLLGKALVSRSSGDRWEYLEGVNRTDPRLAGAVTTKRFLRRYVNSTTNRSRRRAAAVFNIFLCDEMRPVVIPNESDDRKALAKAFPADSSGKPSEHARAMAKLGEEGKHGRDPMCMSCHYKLDPMAKTFTLVGDVLSEELSPGALVYKREDGSLVNIPAQGIGDIGRSIVQQPEYARCQVKHFWNWFMGKDVPLTPERREELVAKFNEVKRKPKAFVSYLVNQPEFYRPSQKLDPQVASYLRAEPFLKDCSECHDAGQGPENFLPLPIGGSAETHRERIADIAKALDLPHEGKDAIMPPSYSGWDKSHVKKAIFELRSWICTGAPNSKGKSTIEKSDLPEGTCVN